MTDLDCTKCPLCGEQSLVPATTVYEQAVTLDRKQYQIRIDALAIEKCGSCGEELFGSEANLAIDRALHEAAGLMTPANMRDAMEALCVSSQVQLANETAVAPESLSRWLQGHVIQSRLADTMLRVYFGVPEARRFLRELHQNPSLRKHVKVEPFGFISPPASTGRIQAASAWNHKGGNILASDENYARAG